MLVLVDGERLNTARQATDRTGAEVGLISPDSINRIEIINGAGTLMYGSDALAGTVNIITNETVVLAGEAAALRLQRFLQLERERHARHRDARRILAARDVPHPGRGREVRQLQGGFVRRRGYAAAVSPTARSSRPTRSIPTSASTSARSRIRSTQPFVRTDGEILNSQAEGKFVNASGLVKLGDRRTLRLRYQSRRMEDVGFPDFEQPFFFNDTSLPVQQPRQVLGALRSAARSRRGSPTCR